MKFTVLKVGKKIADQPPAREGLPPNAERIEWDPDCPGLGLRLRGVSTKGTCVYVRKVDGKKAKRTLGRADAIDRETAISMAAQIEAERQPSPPWLRAAQENRAAPTVEEFGEVYLADWAKRYKPSTLQRVAWTVGRQIAPALGEKHLDAVTPADVANWFDAMPGAPATRNRALAILSGLMLHAEVLGWRKAGSNPCAGMRRRKTSFEAVWFAQREAHRQLRAGRNAAEAMAAAKVFASFSGPMRTNLVDMLDEIGIPPLLGLSSTGALWNGAAGLVHFTSALRYPVFVDGANYSGQPSMLRTPLLRAQLERWLLEEMRALPDAIYVPLGNKVAEALKAVAPMAGVQGEQILSGLLHPSGANNERIACFLGRKPREALSAKTNPESIAAAREALTANVSRLGSRL